MPRRGECIYKRKDGRWEARYVKEIGTDGKKKYGSVYAHSYRAVKDKQQYFSMTPLREIRCSANIKIVDLTMRWLSHIQSQVKLSTYRKYEGLCHNHINPKIGEIPMTLVTRAMVENFSREQLANGNKSGGPLSAKTVNDILVILGLIFSFAEEEYNIALPKISFLREEKKEARVLSVQEQTTLIRCLLTDMDIYKLGALLALYTGIRIGELSALLWEDIQHNCVVINKTLQRLKGDLGKTEIIIGSPKSDSSKRVVPLPDFLIPYIEKFRRPYGYVISTNRCMHTEPRILQQKFRTITDTCHLDDVTFHTLRHTFATRCIEAGFDVKTLSEILGHADVKTTLNRYVHSSFELKQMNMAKLACAFSMK